MDKYEYIYIPFIHPTSSSAESGHGDAVHPTSSCVATSVSVQLRPNAERCVQYTSRSGHLPIPEKNI